MPTFHRFYLVTYRCSGEASGAKNKRIDRTVNRTRVKRATSACDTSTLYSREELSSSQDFDGSKSRLCYIYTLEYGS